MPTGLSPPGSTILAVIKIIKSHPHIFGSVKVKDSEEVVADHVEIMIGDKTGKE